MYAFQQIKPLGTSSYDDQIHGDKVSSGRSKISCTEVGFIEVGFDQVHR